VYRFRQGLVSVVPRLEFFVSDGVSFGGQAGLNYATQGDASSTGFVVGPAVTWYLVRDGRLHPFVRGTVDYVRNTISANGNDGGGAGLCAAVRCSGDVHESRWPAGVLEALRITWSRTASSAVPEWEGRTQHER
jgi:hypothetical protein